MRRVRACVRACVCVRACACVCACVKYDKNKNKTFLLISQ